MPDKIRAFADRWLAENAGTPPRGPGDDYERHVEEIWMQFVIAASCAGYALPAVEAAIGDLEARVRGALGHASRLSPP